MNFADYMQNLIMFTLVMALLLTTIVLIVARDRFMPYVRDLLLRRQVARRYRRVTNTRTPRHLAPTRTYTR